MTPEEKQTTGKATPTLSKAIEKAKELGGVKPETAKALEEVTKVKEAKIGVSSEELQGIDVKLPDPVAQEMENQIEVVEPPKIINGEITFSKPYVQLVKNQIAKDLNNDEFAMYMMMAKRFRLDPLARQITPVVFSKDDHLKRRVSYVTTIDGLRLVAHRTGLFDGVSKPTFTRDNNGNPKYCSIAVYKTGCSHPFEAEVKFSEYTTGRNLWDFKYGKPETMVAKVAEAHALRKAFPQELSGIYTSDEMEATEIKEVKKENEPPKISMMSEQQRKAMFGLMEIKGQSQEKMRGVIKKSWNLDSFKQLTSMQAAALIKKLGQLRDLMIEEGEAVVEFEETPNGQAVDVNLDEVDAGIAKQVGATQ